MASRPPLHVILYGDSGAKKSTMAATFPKPMLVWMFDPWGKELPYVRRGIGRDGGVDAHGTPITEVMSRKDPDKVLIRIEHYLEENMKAPEAYPRFQARAFADDNLASEWATVVFDSTTFAELIARKWHQYRLNPSKMGPDAFDGSKHALQWFSGSTDLLEEILCGKLAGAKTNVVVVCHTETEKDELHGTMVRKPKLPGKRLHSSIPAAYAEMYHLTVRGEEDWIVQTTSNSMWAAATQIQAPNGCEPEYNALWANFDKEGV